MPELWPWPTDDALTRARRVCMEYRRRLWESAPDVAEEVDGIVARLGQTWATGVEISDDDVLTTREAAALLGISPRAVRLAVDRKRLTSAGVDRDGYLFQRSDVIRYLATRRSVRAG